LHCKVLDANDNSPQFDNVTYEVHLSEDVSVGSSVFQAHASDRDSGLNGNVTYMFTKDTTEECDKLFGIHPESGFIYTRAVLDYETRTEYPLYIIASDQGRLLSPTPTPLPTRPPPTHFLLICIIADPSVYHTCCHIMSLYYSR